MREANLPCCCCWEGLCCWWRGPSFVCGTDPWRAMLPPRGVAPVRGSEGGGGGGRMPGSCPLFDLAFNCVRMRTAQPHECKDKCLHHILLAGKQQNDSKSNWHLDLVVD